VTVRSDTRPEGQNNSANIIKSKRLLLFNLDNVLFVSKGAGALRGRASSARSA
jgi:hypothetical protein